MQRDAALARHWYAHAAEAGHVASMNNLARLLYEGRGGGAGPDAAAGGGAAEAWGEPCAASCTVAESGAGMMSSPGARGVPSDLVAAFELFLRAAQLGSSSAAYNLGVCWQQGHSVPGGVPGERAAATCFEAAAAGGHVGAHRQLGQLKLAAGCLLAARQHFEAVVATLPGDADALLQLALLAEQEASTAGGCTAGVLPNASIGSSQASASGGERGSSCAAAADPAALAHQAAAEQLYHRAAQAGSAEAQLWVGAWLWEQGEVEGALRWWYAASAQGHAGALLALGAVAEGGLRGAALDWGAALSCYQAAQALGCVEAGACAQRLQRDVGSQARCEAQARLIAAGGAVQAPSILASRCAR